ncbi:ParB-like nuclease [gut metagenome]|uniref:ParB-like nuclease n=1 Tax=gut metagenome TaxID=749906 RepID=J9FHV4_9ZZZZ
MIKELPLFPDLEWAGPEPERPRGGSQNPIVFHDYESYLAKFKDKNHAKTTDDTYTPRDVYDAVVRYVESIYPLEGKQILRPFYPGGDYRHAEYPADGVVIDNPPFSIFMEIVRFYSARRIPFFLFGNGMTIGKATAYCSLVIANGQIIFGNGACINVNFATNLLPDEVMITTACELRKQIASCPSQHRPAKLPKYRYPDNLLAISTLNTIANGDEDVRIFRKEATRVSKLENRGRLFGDHWLISDEAAARVAAARVAAARVAAARVAAAGVTEVHLSPHERAIVERLNEAAADERQ